MLVQLAAQFFVLVGPLNYFRFINAFNVLIIILKFSIKKFKKWAFHAKLMKFHHRFVPSHGRI